MTAEARGTRACRRHGGVCRAAADAGVANPVADPAGDSRRLLAWVVDHRTARGITVDGNVVVATGSYTGMHVASAPGTVVGEIRGLPPVSLTLARARG